MNDANKTVLKNKIVLGDNKMGLISILFVDLCIFELERNLRLLFSCVFEKRQPVKYLTHEMHHMNCPNLPAKIRCNNMRQSVLERIGPLNAI